MRGFVKDYGGEVVVEDDEDVERGFEVVICAFVERGYCVVVRVATMES